MIASPSRLDALTGIRFFAAAAIVYHHIQGHYGVPTSPYPLFHGVSLFFVLSGFILTHVYPALPDARAVRKFMLSRFARVWPLHALCFLIASILLIGIPDGDWIEKAGTALLNILLLQAWVPVTAASFSFNSVSWTLSNEAFFYALFPLLIADFGRSWHWKLGATLLSGLVLCWLTAVLGLPRDGGPNEITATTLLGILPAARIFQFVAGMCTYLAWRRLRHWQPTSVLLATLLELGTIAAIIWIAGSPSYFRWLAPIFGETFAQWMNVVNALVPFMALLIGLCAGGYGLISKVLSTKLFVFLGEISFSIYMSHLMIHDIISNIFSEMIKTHNILFIFIYIISVFLTSTALFFFVEKRARNFITGRRHATS